MNDTDALKNLSNEYAEFLRVSGYKPRGIEEKKRYALLMIEYLEERKIPALAFGMREAEAFREYLSLLQEKGDRGRFKPATINCVIAHLRGFFGFLLQRGVVGSNPFKHMERMKQGTRVVKNTLTVAQMKALLDALTVHDAQSLFLRVVIEVLYATAARISEIETLQRDDIRLAQGYVVLRDDKDRRDRNEPLTEYATKLLEVFLSTINTTSTPFVMGRPRTLNVWMNNKLKALCVELKLPHISCHAIRHTVATQLLKAGAGIREVQEYLGHKWIRSTEVYTRVAVDDLKELIERRHPREMTHAI